MDRFTALEIVPVGLAVTRVQGGSDDYCWWQLVAETSFTQRCLILIALYNVMSNDQTS